MQADVSTQEQTTGPRRSNPTDPHSRVRASGSRSIHPHVRTIGNGLVLVK